VSKLGRRRRGIRRRRWVAYCEKLGGTHVTKHWTSVGYDEAFYERFWADEAWIRFEIEPNVAGLLEKLREQLPEGHTLEWVSEPVSKPLDLSKPYQDDLNGDWCGNPNCNCES
jgi:hypothetical protein